MNSFVERGQAPHYTDIATEFSVSPAVGKKFLHDVTAVG
jgi:hypothetical protein